MSSCFFMSNRPLLPEAYIIILSTVNTLLEYTGHYGVNRRIRVIDRDRFTRNTPNPPSETHHCRNRERSDRHQSADWSNERATVDEAHERSLELMNPYWNWRTASRSRSVRMNSASSRVAWQLGQLKFDRSCWRSVGLSCHFFVHSGQTSLTKASTMSYGTTPNSKSVWG